MLKVIKETNADLDLHGGLYCSGTLQRIHLKNFVGLLQDQILQGNE